MHVDGSCFKDEFGRTLLLRGVNLGGSSKVPYTPNGATYIREGFFDHRNVSFVGRPFPLEEADEHFARLRQQIFDLEDEITQKRDDLITTLERRMTQKTSLEPLFTIAWKVV